MFGAIDSIYISSTLLPRNCLELFPLNFNFSIGGITILLFIRQFSYFKCYVNSLFYCFYLASYRHVFIQSSFISWLIPWKLSMDSGTKSTIKLEGIPAHEDKCFPSPAIYFKIQGLICYIKTFWSLFFAKCWKKLTELFPCCFFKKKKKLRVLKNSKMSFFFILI